MQSSYKGCYFLSFLCIPFVFLCIPSYLFLYPFLSHQWLSGLRESLFLSYTSPLVRLRATNEVRWARHLVYSDTQKLGHFHPGAWLDTDAFSLPSPKERIKGKLRTGGKILVKSCLKRKEKGQVTRQKVLCSKCC